MAAKENMATNEKRIGVPQANQGFSFVSLSANFSNENLDEKSRRRFVRSHARHVGVSKAKQQVLSDSGSSPDSGTVDSSFQQLRAHVGKFRVTIASRKRNVQVKKNHNGLLSKPRNQFDDANVELLQDGERNALSTKPMPSFRPDKHMYSFISEPSRGHFDPFGALPIPIGSHQQELLFFYHTELTPSFTGFDPKQELISSSAVDAAWLNATFALIALHYDLRLGRDISRKSLFHRGEALRLVKEHLANDFEKPVGQATMGAVALLTVFDIDIGSKESATMHLNGLEHLVKRQGGINELYQKKVLQKLIGWSDLWYSSTWESHPRFRFPCRGNNEVVSERCVRDVERYFGHLELPPGFNVKMREIVQIFRHVSLTKAVMTVDEESCVEFSNCIYLAEYQLSTLFDDELLSSGPSLCVRKSWQLTMYLFLYLALREHPLTSHARQDLVRRLRFALNESQRDIDLWQDNHILLLWILFIGRVATDDPSEREYFVKHLVALCSTLKLDSYNQFEKNLKSVMWLDSFCRSHSTQIWSEIETELRVAQSVHTLVSRTWAGSRLIFKGMC